MAKLTKAQKRKKKLEAKRKKTETLKYATNRARKTPDKELVPDSIVCNDCGGKAPKNSFEFLDHKGLPGIDLIISGICEACSNMTVAILGEPEAQMAALELLNETMGGEGMIGIQDTHQPKLSNP